MSVDVVALLIPSTRSAKSRFFFSAYPSISLPSCELVIVLPALLTESIFSCITSEIILLGTNAEQYTGE